jgi:hypothetical protein
LEVRKTAAPVASSRRMVLALTSQASSVPLLPRGGRSLSWRGDFCGPTILGRPLRGCDSMNEFSPTMEDGLGDDSLIQFLLISRASWA